MRSRRDATSQYTLAITSVTYFFRASPACAASIDEPSRVAKSSLTFAPNLIGSRTPAGCRTTASTLVPAHSRITSPTSNTAGGSESQDVFERLCDEEEETAGGGAGTSGGATPRLVTSKWV